VAHPRTRLVLNFFSNLWRPILAAAEKTGLKGPTLLQNWLSTDDVKNLLHLGGWEVIRPILAFFGRRERLWWIGFVIIGWPQSCLISVDGDFGRSAQTQTASLPHYRCSVVIPARNESGNIEDAVKRTPEMGLGTELIFIEGHSKDDTWGEIQRVAAKYPQRVIKALKQQSKAKAARCGKHSLPLLAICFSSSTRI